MFAKLFATLLLFATLYVVGIFASPDFADTYGNREWNEKIRTWKSGLERYESGSIEPRSLIQGATDIAKPYIDKSQKTIEKVRNTTTEMGKVIDTKTEQVKKAMDSTEEAMNAVEKAKIDLQNTLKFSSGSR